MKSLLRTISMLVLFAPLMAGCATYDLIKAPPAQSLAVSVVYSSQGASGWNDLPIGTYRVPNSDVIISGHQVNGGLGVALFGVVGVLAEDAAGSSKGKSSVKDSEDALHIDLAPQAAALTQKLVASGRFGQTFTATATNGPTLTVIPYTVLTFVNDTDVRPYVFLKVSLKADGKDWSARYISSAGKAVALAGSNSLTANGGELLKTVLAQELERAVTFMLQDVAKPFPRDENNMVTVDIDFPFVRGAHGQIAGYKLEEDDQFLIYAPKIADANVFSGVFVLGKPLAQQVTASSDTPPGGK